MLQHALSYGPAIGAVIGLAIAAWMVFGRRR
jgi:hypothetical protein